MRIALIIALLYPATATTGQVVTEWWHVLGAPCTTKIDRIELKNCELTVLTKPRIIHAKKDR